MRGEFSVIYSAPQGDRVLVTIALPEAP